MNASSSSMHHSSGATRFIIIFIDSTFSQAFGNSEDSTLVHACMKLETNWTWTPKLNTLRRLLIIVIIVNLNFFSSASFLTCMQRDSMSMFGHADQ
jgi:hypothetical protein